MHVYPDDENVIKSIVPDEQDNRPFCKVDEQKSVMVYQKAIQFTADFSINAQRLLRTVIGLIGDDDKPGKVYTFTVEDFSKLFNFGADPSKRLINAGKELGKRFFLPDPYDNNPNSGIVIGWIDYLRIRGGIVTVRFQPELLGVYQRLKERSYSLGNIKHFKTPGSFVLYEKFITMLADDNKVNFYMSIEDIRTLFNLENKYIFSNGTFYYSGFKKRVLKYIFNDINGSDLVDNPCNVNFTYTEVKAGRRVIGLEFQVWRVYSTCSDIVVRNPFYESLDAETKSYFDIAVSFGVDPVEVETAITRYSSEGFKKTMLYLVNSHKNKGLPYWVACIRNGWIDNRSGNRFSFERINKSIAFSKQLYSTIREFLFCLDERQLYAIFQAVCDSLQSTKPQIGEYMKFHENDLSSLIEHEGFMTFVYDEVSEFLKKNEPPFISNLYNEYTKKISRGIKIPKNDNFFKKGSQKVSVNTNLIEKNADADVVDTEIVDSSDAKDNDLASSVENSLNECFNGRDEIIALLRSEKITDKEVLKSILLFDDDYIKQNVEYCINTYRVRKGQHDIGGVIISACQKDFAGCLEKRQILKEKEAENIKRREEEKRLEKVQEFKSLKASLSDEELEEIINFSEMDVLIREEASSELKRRSDDKENVKYREFFFSLPEDEQKVIVDSLIESSFVFRNFATNCNYEELWNKKTAEKMLVNALKFSR